MWPIIVSGVWFILTVVLGWIFAKIFHLENRWHVARELATDFDTDAEALQNLKDSEKIKGERPLRKYDVFINHRGPDVKLTFAADLTDALCKAGFHPFLDAKSIGQGRHVFDSIAEALSGACVHVAIFSKRYAESKYCLEELTSMLQSNHIILPVFYNVKPEDLRWIDKGPFAGGFRKHSKRRRQEKIKLWKEALWDISERRGFRIDEFDGDEKQLIRSIVNTVHKEMPIDLQPQTHQFGLEEPLKEVLDRIHEMNSNDVGILGLFGMGGIGKTTLATEIYNYFVSLRSFHYHSFLKDVRSSGPLELQRQLVRDLIQEEMTTSTKKYSYWFHTFKDRRALIIIDDIDNIKQFLNLILDIRQLSPGSRIIVTSRHRDVLNSTLASTDCKNIYEVKVLNPTYSRLLFNWHAFLSETPSEGFHDLAERVADACGGHPLALTLIGASLFDKREIEDREIWLDAVKTLNENPDIQSQLRISYDSLPTTGDKAMFRDIACLLIGMREQVAMEIWNSCNPCSAYCSTSKGPHLVLRRLVDKSLVRVEAGKLSMHDVIRDMGREIVTRASSHPWEEPPKHPGERTHLWEATTAAKVLTKNQGTDRILGIKLSRNENVDSAPPYVTNQFSGMEELHLLVLDGCSVEGSDFRSWSPELRWLQWRSIPRAELPSPLHLPNLTVLDLTDSGNLTHLWRRGTVVQFPLLQRLVLTRCRALEELPSNIGRSTPRLKTIEMESCSVIGALPDSLGQLKYLEQFVLSGCKNLGSLPDAIVNLTNLKRFMLDGCSKLRELPFELGKLLNLSVLQLSNCEALHELPASVTKLRLLKELDMKSACKLDGQFPLFLGALTALTTLHLCGNKIITVVPKSFGDLKSLVHLQMEDCPALVSVEALPRSLHHLNMANCDKLVTIPSLADARLLAVLNLRDCRALTDVQGLECLTTLEEINLAGCASMSRSGLFIVPGSALRLCYLSGSNVGIKYDTTWCKKEPALQILSYYDHGIGYIANGMSEKVLDRTWSYELIVETTIVSNAKCVALIICCVGHDQGFSSYSEEHGQYNSHCNISVEIKRGSRVVTDTQLFAFRHADGKNQVYICTLRRKHFLIESLQLGDKICVYARSRWAGWAITVLEAAVCVVHGEDEQQVIAVNSELLSRIESEGLAAKLGELVLADHCHSSQMSELGCDKSSTMESKDVKLASEATYLRECTVNPLPIEQEWSIEPTPGPIFSWKHSWKLPRRARGSISFTAQGNTDVQVAISAKCQSSDDMYQICFGGWQNTMTSIGKRYQGPVAFAVAAFLTYPDALNRLWISIDDRTSTIQVGRGEPGQDVFSIYKDDRFFSDVQYVSFTSHITPVTFSNVIVSEMEHMSETSDSYSLSKWIHLQDGSNWNVVPLHGHYNWARFWTLPRPGRGLLSFAAEGIDVHIAISAEPHTTQPMYEILIGGWENSQTIVRKHKQERPALWTEESLVEFPSCQYWVLVDEEVCVIQIGRGVEPGQDMFCTFKDPDFLLGVQYITFTSSKIPIVYSDVTITDIAE